MDKGSEACAKNRSGESTEYSFDGSSLTNWEYWKPPRSWLVTSGAGASVVVTDGVWWRFIPFSL